MTRHEGKVKLEELFHTILEIYLSSVPEKDIPDFLASLAQGLQFGTSLYKNFTLREEE